MGLLMLCRQEVLETGHGEDFSASLGNALQQLWLQYPEVSSLAALARKAMKWFPEELLWNTSGVLVLELEAELKGRNALGVRLLQQSDCSYLNRCVQQLSGNGAWDGSETGW